MTKDKRVETVARALAMGGINASHSAVELILGIIELTDKKGEDIALKDVTSLADGIKKKAEKEAKKELVDAK